MDCPICRKELIPAPTGYEIDTWHCSKCDTFYGIDESGKLRLLRKSPGVSWYAGCMGMELAGKKFSDKASARKAFKEAAKECAKKEG